jgi:hypothetical protein
MTLIADPDLATYCGRIGNLYTRHGLSPPFGLYDAARGWISHCVDVIERYLSRHAGSCYSGSGDWNFAWLNSLIQTTWHERSFAMPPRSAPQRSHHNNWSDNYGSEEPNQKSRRGANLTVAPKLDSKHDSFEPDHVGLRQKVAKNTKSASPQQTQRPQRSASGSFGRTLAPSPKKIDIAAAWLRAELASGERAAAEVEANALCAGIAPRTYDRARQRLGVTSRRIGFGRWAKYMIALPVVDGTPSKGANMAGAT